MKRRSYAVIIEKDQEGYYAFSPQLPGSYTRGQTYAEALRNVSNAVRSRLRDAGEEMPYPDIVCMSWQEMALMHACGKGETARA
jgi:predicted RNase H-like HicB family nuclease